MSYYDDLEVPRTASQDKIDAAYRALAQKYHPDKNPGRERAASLHFKRIQEALRMLSNPKARAAYDEAIRHMENESDTGQPQPSAGMTPSPSAKRESDRRNEYEQPRSSAAAEQAASATGNTKVKRWYRDYRIVAVCIAAVLLLIAGISSIAKRPPSAEAVATKKKAEDDSKIAELDRADEILKREEKAAQRQQSIALAKAKLKAVQLEGDQVLDQVRALDDELVAWDQTITPLLTDQRGRSVAAADDRIRAFEVVWNKKRPSKADAKAIRDRITVLLEPIESELAKPTPVWQPDGALSAQLKIESIAIEGLVQEVKGQKRQIERLVEVAGRGAKTGKLSLEDAIKDLADRDDSAKNDSIATIERENKQKLEAAEAERLRQEGEDEIRVVKAKTEGSKSNADAKIAKDKLIKKAKSASTRTLLSFFFTPGYVQPLRKTGAEMRPISYSKLDAIGALAPTVDGQQSLLDVLLDYTDKDRAIWQVPGVGGVGQIPAEKRTKLLEIQKALIELGPTLVELEMLDP